MNISLTQRTPRLQPASKAPMQAKNVSTEELYTQTALEGDTPYSKSNENVFTFLGSLVGGPGARPGPSMTDLQRGFRKHGLEGKATAGEIRKSLAVKMAKKVGKGAAVVGLGLAMGAGSVALFSAASSLAGAAGLIVGGAALVTTLYGASTASAEVGEVRSLRKQTGQLAESAAQRINQENAEPQSNENGTLTVL